MANDPFGRTAIPPPGQADEQRTRMVQTELQERLMTLAAASQALLSSPSVEDVLPATLHLAEQMVPADGYAIWRLQGNLWRIDVSSGISESFTRVEVSRDELLVPFTTPLVFEDVEQMPALERRLDAYRTEGIRGMLAVPMSIRGEATGSLTFYYRRPHQFTDVETQIALALGNLASAALTTGELYDAQRRIRRQSDFLAETASVLAKSLDYHATLKRVVDLAVPHIADWCTVDLVGEGGAIERLAVAHVDPAKAEIARRYRERYPERPDARYGVQYVINTGVPTMIEHVTDDMFVTANAGNPEHLAAVLELGIRSFMCVPLVARGRTLGAMTFVSGESNRHYNATDLQFASDIASRSALAVDNARAYEEARRASQLKDEFLATLSHELRTPLNAILGYSRMLKSGLLDGPKQARGLEILERNAASLTQIVEDVLDVSRIISGKLTLHVQPLDLAAILVQGIATVQPAADAKNVRIHVDIDPDAAPLVGDPDRLQQVIWNLLSNAVKFTPSGEQISVRLSKLDAHVEMAVTDTGVGIALAFLPHVFERFRQADSRLSREHGGLGLGLAISRHIVEMHGGTIDAQSEGPGKGATFAVRLPATRRGADVRRRMEPRVLAPGSSPAPRPSLAGVRVLAVDDDDDSLEMLREILESAGAEVHTAQSGDEALEMLKVTRPQVLVSDLGMPGMDGFELIGRVRHLPVTKGGRIPAAALTAYARSEDRTRSLRAGFQMHLSKPIEPEELLVSVKALAEWDESMF